jgi:catechol 2,3-dioxygenase-like lactoylglutathione lyase family enzyme
MGAVTRCSNSFPDVCVTDVRRSVDFYRTLLGLDVITDHGWYAELGANDRTMIAFVQRGHETIPAVASTDPRGVVLSFEVDDVGPVYDVAKQLGCEVLIDLAAELGQHHFMIIDPGWRCRRRHPTHRVNDVRHASTRFAIAAATP